MTDIPKKRGRPKKVKAIEPVKAESLGIRAKDPVYNKLRKDTAQRVIDSGNTPLEFFVDLYRSPFPPEIVEMLKTSKLTPELVIALTDWKNLCFEAAKAAAPYVHSKLTNVVLQGDPDKPVVVRKEDLQEAARRMLFALTMHPSEDEIEDEGALLIPENCDKLEE